MKVRSFKNFFASTTFVLIGFLANGQSSQFVKEVNPLIGVLGAGNTHPAATLPYSVVSLGPDAAYPQSTSGYSLTPNNSFIGFSHTRTSGTGGGGRYGNFLVTPQSGRMDIVNKESSLKNEFASPGFYSCDVEKGNIHAALTLTEHVGFHQYSFHENDTAIILLDISSTRLTKDKSKCTEAEVEILSDKSLQGYAKFEGGWGGLNPYTIFFYAEFDKPSLLKGTWKQNIVSSDLSASSKTSKNLYLGVFFKFILAANEKTVKLKLALSYKSVSGAKKYFDQSQGWDFDVFKKKAEEKWTHFLSRIQVIGGTADQRKLFYTSFYKTAMMPRDLTGDNPLWKSGAPHFWDFYTFWDTYRTVNPLLSLVDPKKESEIIQCLLDIYQHKGWLPDAFTAGNYGTIQGGTNADVVVAEAIVKGLKGFNYELAYKAMINDAEKQAPNPGATGRYVNVFERYGYLPTQSLTEFNNPPCGTSRSIEYSYNDFCIALAAKKLGKEKDYKKFLDRSASVFNTLFYDSVKLFWAKDSNGRWLSNFSTKSNSFSLNGKWQGWMGPFYEGSPLSYSCAAQQDIARIIRSHGGNKEFISFLDTIFDSGKFESDNEPALNLPWMYIYAGAPHKTYERLQTVLNEKFKTTLDGWPGDDDAGTISAWYMWSAMGMYPIAGQDIYLLTTPVFVSTKFSLQNGKTFMIQTKNLSLKNTFIQSATLNGKPFGKAWIRHADILKGGKLILVMGSKPSGWGSKNLAPSFDKLLRD